MVDERKEARRRGFERIPWRVKPLRTFGGILTPRAIGGEIARPPGFSGSKDFKRRSAKDLGHLEKQSPNFIAKGKADLLQNCLQVRKVRISKVVRPGHSQM